MRCATQTERESINKYVQSISISTGINFYYNFHITDMQKLANTFQAAHRNGTVSHITDYSFKFTIQPKKDTDKPKEVIYYESYFLEL